MVFTHGTLRRGRFEGVQHLSQDKWRLLPHFLRITKQHIASYDYFVDIDIKKVVAAEANRVAKRRRQKVTVTQCDASRALTRVVD